MAKTLPHAFLVGRLVVAASWSSLAGEPPKAAFSFDALRERARELATKEYKAQTQPELPEYLKKLDYDGYQDIRFRPEQGLWYGQSLRFGIQFLHRGYLYQDPVRMHLIEDGQVRDIPFTPQLYNYGKNHFSSPVPSGLDFAGLRVIYPFTPPKWDEIASFIGASYFRLVGPNQRYGAACRGVAIDTAEPSGEEFPRFTEFWMEKPAALAEALNLFALLDSSSLAGAFHFVLKPGPAMRVDVDASLFFRKPVKKLGIAPLTSMFLEGENRTRYIPDFRPEIHDSDGLLLENAMGAEWLWRPLQNPDKAHQVTQFPAMATANFGLLQRDRRFCDYEDLAGRYEMHPSLWVQTSDPWGEGTVELVEIPTASEWNDNVVAYWLPKQKIAPNQEARFVYSILATSTEPPKSQGLRVQATRIDPERGKKPVRFIVDFEGSPLPPLDSKLGMAAKVQASHGEVRNVVTQPNEVTGGWRAFFDLGNPGSDPVDLRLELHNGGRQVSETWVYRFTHP